MATLHDLLAKMASHIGRARGIHVDLLAAEMGIPAREVRKLVVEARMQGHRVCGYPASGYFIAETAEELEETCRFLRARSMTSLVQEARLRRVALPDLLGQLHLPT